MATIGDIVLVYQEEQPAFLGRIEDILADSRPDWYHVKLLVLQIPVLETVWILREAYINGETFTMNGVRLRIEKVRGSNRPQRESLLSDNGSPEVDYASNDKVISLFDRKKR